MVKVTMIILIQKKECTGCSACYNICPKNAIEMIEDKKGFKYPNIDKEKCDNCKLCQKVCPILNSNIVNNIPRAYAVINNNEITRNQSSSGGVFSLLAEYIIDNNGVVFGAAFDENWKVKHYYKKKKKDIEKFRGSKYLQSTIGNTYKLAKEFLKIEKKVLFTGTPCQIEGLKSYLMKDYENLYTLDIICHGVPSPKVHDKYLEYQKNKFKTTKINKIEHRNKENGWKDFNLKIEFDKKTYKESHQNDLFMQFFLKNTILRDSCYNCHFKKKNRISDITLADFWGIENVMPDMDDGKGTSLVIVNSKKGQELLENIKDKIQCKKVDFETAIKYNPSMTKSVKKDKKSDKFFKNSDKMEFDKLVKKYTYTPSKLKKIINKIKGIIKKIINK